MAAVGSRGNGFIGKEHCTLSHPLPPSHLEGHLSSSWALMESSLAHSLPQYSSTHLELVSGTSQ